MFSIKTAFHNIRFNLKSFIYVILWHANFYVWKIKGKIHKTYIAIARPTLIFTTRVVCDFLLISPHANECAVWSKNWCSSILIHNFSFIYYLYTYVYVHIIYKRKKSCHTLHKDLFVDIIRNAFWHARRDTRSAVIKKALRWFLYMFCIRQIV